VIDPGVAVCSGRGMFIKSPENGLTVRQGFPDLRVRMKAPQLAPCPSIERWSRSVTHSGESRKGSSLLAEDRIESTEQSAGLSLLGAGELLILTQVNTINTIAVSGECEGDGDDDR